MSKSEFDAMKVHLWVSGTTDQEDNGGWACMLHTIISGHEYTKTLGGYGKSTTPTRMTLQAVLNGLLQLRTDKPIFLHIYTSVVQVSSGLNRNMYKWADNNWLTTKSVVPQHLDLWSQIHQILTDKNRVLTYQVHIQNYANSDQPHRLFTIQQSASYLAKGKQDLYEVQLT